jgi:type I restriction enzyme S subunit
MILKPSDHVNRPPLPSNWCSVALSTACDLRLGHQLTPSIPGLLKVRYLRAGNIADGVLLLEDVKQMSLTPDEVEELTLLNGDIVVAEASGSSSHVGRAALWDNSIPECCFQNTVIRMRCHRGVYPEYILEYFRYARLSGILASLSRGVGIQHVSVTRLGSLHVPVPPTDEQGRIVAELTQARAVASKVSSHASSGASLLEGQLVRSLEALKDVRASRTLLSSVCNLHNGRAFKATEWSNKGLPIIRIQNLRDQTASFNHYPDVVNEQHLVRRGDLLFAWSATFGPYIWTGSTAALNQHIFKIEMTTPDLSVEFLYWWLRALLPKLKKKIRGGAGLQHLRKGDILKLEVATPSRKTQSEWVNRLEREQLATTQGADLATSMRSRAEDLLLRKMRSAFDGALDTNNPEEHPVHFDDTKDLHRRKKTQRNKPMLPHETLPEIGDSILSILHPARSPLKASDIFDRVRKDRDVDAVVFNQALLDLVSLHRVDMLKGPEGTTYRTRACA